MLKETLEAAAREYDKKQRKKRGYNIHALRQYLERIEQVCEAINKGGDVATELGKGFTGSLLKAMAKAAKVEAKEQGNFAY